VQKYSTTATGAAALPLILLLFFLSRWSGGLVARYGSKIPLIVGPLIVAAGFLLFALTSVGGSYWTTFFPAFVVLGLGLAVSVAPLTTVVMSSVDQTRAGAASGINNAVSRVAGVLAVAVLGIVMVSAFNHRLQVSLASLDIAPVVRHKIQSNAIRLGGMDVPAGLDAQTSSAIQSGINMSFIFGFRLIMLLCAGLAAASAMVALRMIPSHGPAHISDIDAAAGN
jgi:hypothetical protein